MNGNTWFAANWPTEADGLQRQMAYRGRWPTEADGLLVLNIHYTDQ